MYRSPADRAACSVCGEMVRGDDGCSDDLSGWRACELCWNRAVGRDASDGATALLTLGVSGLVLALWELLASAR